MNALQAASLIQQASKTSWDKEFLSNERIKSWLINEVTMVPFDPNTKTLLEYVKERMAAAEVLQQRQKQAQVAQQDMQAQPFQPQQQHPQQQQQFASVTQAPSQSQAVGASVNGVRQITPESMEENGHSSDSLNEGDGEEEQYQFGLDDFVVSDPEQPSGFDRSPSPLSQTMSIQTGQPFTNPSAYAYPNQQPFIQHQHHDLHLHPNSRPFTSQQHQAPSNLDPALLSLNPAASGTYGGVTITPGQLVAPAQSRFVPPATAQQQYWQQASSQQRLSPAPSASQRSNNKREKSPVMSTVPASKRQRTASVEAAPSDSNSKQKQSGSSNSPNPKSVLKPAQALKPLSESEQVWHKIETEVRRNLALANKAPIGTVQKLFKLLSLYVTEPLNATKTGVREATVTDLSVPPMGRIAILSALKDKTEEQFDTCFVTDPRATVLLADWARDLALLARKGKARGGVDDEAALKMTARPLMEVFRKLPISLQVLRTLKGVGRSVNIISTSDVFDEVSKDIAAQLVKKWHRLAEAKDGLSAPSSSGASKSGTARKRLDSPPSAGAGSSDGDADARKKQRLSTPVPTIKVKAERSEGKLPTAGAKGPPTTASTIVKTVPVVSSSLGTKPLGAPPGKGLPAFAKRRPNPASSPSSSSVKVGGAVSSCGKPAAQAGATSAPAAPAPFDPFAMSLQDMVKSKEAASGMSLGDTLNALHMAVDSADSHNVPRASSKKGKKSVRWEDPGKLEQVKLVEVLVYGDEFGNEIATENYLNTTGEMEGEAEGAAMGHLVEELDWEEPAELDLSNLLPDSMAVYPLAESVGDKKPEADAQREREETTLATVFFDDSDIPPCPTEPTEVLAQQTLPDSDPSIIKMRFTTALEQDEEVKKALAALADVLSNGSSVSSSGGDNVQAQHLMHSGAAQASAASLLAGLQHSATATPAESASVAPLLASAPQDLSALLAKLAPAAAPLSVATPAPLVTQATAVLPVVGGPAPIASGYGYSAPAAPIVPLPPYQPAPAAGGNLGAPAVGAGPPAGGYPNPSGNNWWRPAPIDWNNVGSLPRDAYRRKKGGRKL